MLGGVDEQQYSYAFPYLLAHRHVVCAVHACKLSSQLDSKRPADGCTAVVPCQAGVLNVGLRLLLVLQVMCGRMECG